MAPTQGHDLDLTPSEKVARRILSETGKNCPPEIYQFASNFCKITEDAIPPGVDGFVLYHDGELPNVFINSVIPKTRKIFTLAHELGHILIPWHYALFTPLTCNMDNGENSIDPVYWQMEKEANQFASYLLAPHNWLRSIWRKTHSFTDVLDGVTNSTGMSKIAASFALIRILPPGSYFYQTDWNNVIEYSSKTASSLIQLQQIGQPLELSLLQILSDRSEYIEAGTKNLYWGEINLDAERPAKLPKNSSTEIARKIIESICKNKSVQNKISNRINGIAGSAKSMGKPKNAMQYYNFLRQRFFGRNDPNIVSFIEHEQFMDFLNRKAYETFS